MPAVGQSIASCNDSKLDSFALLCGDILRIGNDLCVSRNRKRCCLRCHLVAVLIGNNAAILISVAVCCRSNRQCIGLAAGCRRIIPTATGLLVVPAVGQSIASCNDSKLDSFALLCGDILRIGNDLCVSRNRKRCCLRCHLVAVLIGNNAAVLISVAVCCRSNRQCICLAAGCRRIIPTATGFLVLPAIGQSIARCDYRKLDRFALLCADTLRSGNDLSISHYRQSRGIRGHLVAILVGDDTAVLVTIAMSRGYDGQSIRLTAACTGIRPAAVRYLVLPAIGQAISISLHSKDCIAPLRQIYCYICRVRLDNNLAIIKNSDNSKSNRAPAISKRAGK